MKAKILALLVCLPLALSAQNPIASFYPQDNSLYKIVQSAAGIDQTTAGANVSWNFTDFIETGSSSDLNLNPTTNEVATYPNTDKVTKNTSNLNSIVSDSYMYSKNNNNQISITGLVNPSITLNFSTNNAVVGTFPMNYGYTNSDTMAGTYVYGTYNGTFSGNINIVVDAYGTLNMTINGVQSNYTVTRLKSTQNLSLNYSIFPNVGTIVQTVYTYYEAGNSSPVFRSTETVVNVPLQGIVDETTLVMEKFDGVLSNTTFDSKTVLTYPNPANDRLFLNENDEILKITLTDLRGRIVKNITKPEYSIDISDIQNGTYIVELETSKGIQTQKILKN